MNNKILIVEDEFVVANSLRLLLEKAGYSICGIASSTEEAEDILKNNTPNLVILDIRLDGKPTGIDLARKLRADNIAFIYLSANSSQKILEEAKKTEPYGFLVKPFREKDLLVTLNIAAYRHQYSLESKLRQEDFLQNQLGEINNEPLDAKQKLLKIACLLQSHIPFDYFMAGARPCDVEQLYGYLRIGFDEYQFIDEKELITITGIKRDAFSAAIKNTPVNVDLDIGSNKDLQEPSLQKMVFDCFKLESYLVFPVALHNGTTFQYFFYSRQHNVYTQNHVALLKLIKVCLTGNAEKIILEKTTPVLTTYQSGSVYKKATREENRLEFQGIIGKHPLLLNALDLTLQVAPYNTSVLILGESGTGKERVAQCIHSLSPRKDSPFIKVNCAAIPASLIESELFGHEKGAFTGAIEKRKGKFEQADGGTIFLDEIGELSLDMQVKILRVLQEKEIDYVGGSLPKKINVRVVVATNRNLEKEVANRNFRLDLYYRLNVFPITLPSLRERKSDLSELALYFAKKFCKEFNKEFIGITTPMMEEIHAYHWPGNIRELENVLQRSVILNNGKSKLELKPGLTIISTGLSEEGVAGTFEYVKFIQRETERDYIISILKKADGRVRGNNGAAELLKIKPTTLESKMAKLGIRKDHF